MKYFSLLVLTFLTFSIIGRAQVKSQVKIDSIISLVNKSKADSSRLKFYIELSKVYININADSALKYAAFSYDLSKKEHNSKAIALALNTMGLGYKIKGNLMEALKCYQQALKIFVDNKDSVGIARCYNNIGNVYNYRNDNKNALMNYLTSLDIRSRLKDRNGIGACLSNIGLVYFNMKNYSDALKYYELARDTLKNGGDRQYLGSALDNIGDIMVHYGNFKAAEKFYKEALRIRIEIDDSSAIASSYISLCILYNDQGRLKEAEKFGLMANKMCKKAASIKLIIECTATLSDVYEKLGNYKLSKLYFEEHIEARDSLFSAESEKKLVEQQMQFDFDKREALAKVEQIK